MINVVTDQLYGADYKEEEDPRKFISEKTGRGPLGDNWIEEIWEEIKVSILNIYLYDILYELKLSETKAAKDFVIILHPGPDWKQVSKIPT